MAGNPSSPSRRRFSCTHGSSRSNGSIPPGWPSWSTPTCSPGCSSICTPRLVARSSTPSATPNVHVVVHETRKPVPRTAAVPTSVVTSYSVLPLSSRLQTRPTPRRALTRGWPVVRSSSVTSNRVSTSTRASAPSTQRISAKPDASVRTRSLVTSSSPSSPVRNSALSTAAGSSATSTPPSRIPSAASPSGQSRAAPAVLSSSGSPAGPSGPPQPARATSATSAATAVRRPARALPIVATSAVGRTIRPVGSARADTSNGDAP